jgi:hypothetical protein
MGLSRFIDGFSRIPRDQAQAESQLPSATRYLNVDGVRGWLYPISTELGDAFQLFLYFDGAAYQVRVVEPEVEGRFDPHASHVLPDGRICLSESWAGGASTLEAAYARSVVWCNGFSRFLRGESFPQDPALARST